MSWVRIPPEQLFFLLGEKRVVWVSCLSIYRKEFSCASVAHAALKPGIIFSNSGIPGGDAKTWDNPGKPGIIPGNPVYLAGMSCFLYEYIHVCCTSNQELELASYM